MSTFVIVNTFTHSATYVADKVLLLLKDIIRDSGLSPEKLANEWRTLQHGISTWLASKDLQAVHLEVFNPYTDSLIGRWDFDLYYGTAGDGAMWVNTEDIKYHILKAGHWPSTCEYRIVTTIKPGSPRASGWSSTTFRSTEGFVRQSIGTTIDGNGYVSAGTAYWRKSS